MRLRLHAHAPLITLLPLHSDHTDAVEIRTRERPRAGGHTTTAGSAEDLVDSGV